MIIFFRLEAEKLAEVHKAGWTKRQERAKQGQERRQRESAELEELNKGTYSCLAMWVLRCSKLDIRTGRVCLHM